MNWNSLINTSLNAIHILIIPLVGVLIWLIKVLTMQNTRIQILEDTTVRKEEFQASELATKEDINNLELTTKENLHELEIKILKAVNITIKNNKKENNHDTNINRTFIRSHTPSRGIIRVYIFIHWEKYQNQSTNQNA